MSPDSRSIPLAQIAKNWDWPDILRQTPGGTGRWHDIQFTLAPAECSDYLIVLNRASADLTVRCPPEHVWAVIQEPPNEYFGPMHWGAREYARVYTSDTNVVGKRYVHSQPALPWHINKDYDFLVKSGVSDKRRDLSWITSNIAAFQGHRDRLDFLNNIRGRLKFDLFGRGFSELADKWDGLAPYRYSIVVENFRNQYYWSEKIADCFLSWTKPIYYGCTNITRFFPPESMLCIDIRDPDAAEKIREETSRDSWRRSLDAIAEARQLILEKYQLFPFLAQEIRDHATQCTANHRHRVIEISSSPKPPYPISYVLSREIRGWLARVHRKVSGLLARTRKGIS